MTSRSALIDGDVVAWKAATAVQKVEEDIYGYVQPFANIAEGQCAADNIIANILKATGATKYKVCLSDPSGVWRKELYPEYKGNRKDIIRPLLLGRLMEYLRVIHGGSHWAGLEADDMLGILGTEPREDEDRIIASNDKDMQGIPAPQYTIGDTDPGTGKARIRTVTHGFAKRFHLIQTLCGDRVDGYYGCPNIGMVRAERIIDDPKQLIKTTGVVTKGPRKGEETARWISHPTTDLWACVVSHYRKAGLTERDALLNARLAYILRHEDYDRETGEITLWTPAKLNVMRIS